jgi:uncharacterized protein YceH (UPF0502 family)
MPPRTAERSDNQQDDQRLQQLEARIYALEERLAQIEARRDDIQD